MPKRTASGEPSTCVVDAATASMAVAARRMSFVWLGWSSCPDTATKVLPLKSTPSTSYGHRYNGGSAGWGGGRGRGGVTVCRGAHTTMGDCHLLSCLLPPLLAEKSELSATLLTWERPQPTPQSAQHGRRLPHFAPTAVMQHTTAAYHCCLTPPPHWPLTCPNTLAPCPNSFSPHPLLPHTHMHRPGRHPAPTRSAHSFFVPPPSETQAPTCLAHSSSQVVYRLLSRTTASAGLSPGANPPGHTGSASSIGRYSELLLRLTA